MVPEGERAAVFDESLRLLRSVLEQDDVSFAGDYFSVSSVAVAPRPVKPLDIWLGGSAPAGFRRIGRLGDGWLGSFLTPAEAGRGREQIQQAAEAAGRQIEPDHFGINLAVSDAELPDELAAAVRRRRPDIDPTQLISVGWSHLHRQSRRVPRGRADQVRHPAGRAVPHRGLHRPVRGRTSPAAELTRRPVLSRT